MLSPAVKLEVKLENTLPFLQVFYTLPFAFNTLRKYIRSVNLRASKTCKKWMVGEDFPSWFFGWVMPQGRCVKKGGLCGSEISSNILPGDPLNIRLQNAFMIGTKESKICFFAGNTLINQEFIHVFSSMWCSISW